MKQTNANAIITPSTSGTKDVFPLCVTSRIKSGPRQSLNIVMTSAGVCPIVHCLGSYNTCVTFVVFLGTMLLK